MVTGAAGATKRVHLAEVVANVGLCREHFQLTSAVNGQVAARAGQFVHLCPAVPENPPSVTSQDDVRDSSTRWGDRLRTPMLRRAFSVADHRCSAGRTEIDIIYRAVGKASRWMASLIPGDSVSLLGPLGNTFPISDSKPTAWLVAGGVGLPPMLYLARALRATGKLVTAFFGAQRRDLVPLTLRECVIFPADGRNAVFGAEPFTGLGVPIVLSTDDGSLGFPGHVGRALEAFKAAQVVKPDEVVVYTCGPERMMRFVAEVCTHWGMECHVCMERAMACGMGTCQSCVVPVHDPQAIDGWTYRLCCTEGPVFNARMILWDDPSRETGG